MRPSVSKKNVEFDLKPVRKKPSRKFRKGSKYDLVIDEFKKGKHNLVKVEVPDMDSNYLRTQLKKRIDVRDLNEKLQVSVVNNVTYLEKKIS